MKEFMKTFLAALLGVIAGFACLVFLGVLIVAIAGAVNSVDVEDGSWLVVRLEGALPEYDPPASVLGEITGGSPETLQRVLDNLARARADDRIAGVVLKLGSGFGAGGGKTQELRDAIKKTRNSGKEVIAFAESLNRNVFYLAAACDRIVAPPSAYVTFQGFASTSLHLRGSLAKLGIEPQVHKIKDYKAAAEMVLRTDASEFAKENKQWVLDDLWTVFVEEMKADRGLSEEKLVSTMEQAVFSVEEAKEAGLVDEVAYWNQLRESLIPDGEEEFEGISSAKYAEIPLSEFDLGGDIKIAVVHAQGMIGGRQSRIDPMLGLMIGYETVIADLEKAAADDSIDAIILRVDSRGGDAYGSDQMGHVVETVSAKKPVVASMVDVAASGGYHIAYRANRILVDPLTITGSIGSIRGTFNLSGLHEKLGISMDHVTRGPMALFGASDRAMNDEEWTRFRADHWNGYNVWLKDVAEHRGMSFEQAEKLAHGRVWTGRQAVANGLVDEIGNLDKALEVAATLAEKDPEQGITAVHFPQKKSLLEALTSGEAGADTVLNWILYRYVREDLAASWEMMQSNRMLLLEELPR